MMTRLIICAVLAAACAAPAAAAADTAPAADVDAVVLTVNDVPIMASQVKKEMDYELLQYKGKLTPHQASTLIPQIKKRAVETLINQVLVLQEATRRALEPTKRQVTGHLNMLV